MSFRISRSAQFELLEALTIGWEEGDGRTLFVVGDPMQSIYQFREAEVGLMLRIRDQGIGALRLRALHLTRNFRSVAPLVDLDECAFRAPLAGQKR
jgi:ATP-dependent helicase/nuclease subunit A